MNIPCLKCKGSTPMKSCGRMFCPIIAKSNAMSKVAEFKQNFFGSSPAPFVGHNMYPNVFVGILSPNEPKMDVELYDAPSHWAGNNYQIQEIVNIRSTLVNSRFKSNIKDQSKFLEIGKEIGMASRPVDVEINLKSKPYFKLNSDPYNAPMGPNATLDNAKITGNPTVDTRVEKVVSDTDLKANNALTYLFGKGFNENFLTKLLSMGNLGIKKSRRLVPTRWSITATDDALSKHLLDKVKNYSESDYVVYFGNYLGNYFMVMFFPEVWSYELFEMYAPKAEWNTSSTFQHMTDYEGYNGRKTYADNCGGGYYAARLPIVEKLEKVKRQSSVLVLRFITGEYAAPLGVWVVRETMRKTLANSPMQFASKEVMISYVVKLVKSKFNYNVENLLKESVLLNNIKIQQKLTKFL
ncbi:MAG: hypothetical protein ABIC04_01220 [Nanoarchaeota archaeon]